MKPRIYFAYVALITLVLYAWASFFYWSFDASTWSHFARFCLGVPPCVLSVAALFANEESPKQ